MSNILNELTTEQIRTDLPNIQIGDTVKVHQEIRESKTSDKKRVQMFEGIVIAIKNGNQISKRIKVRRIASGVGVEKTFMVNHPSIKKIDIVRHGVARRAKLYFLRYRVGKAARLKEKLGN
ncbi:MAG: 50S ribosomal protein L19 [Clostridiales bacterium]|jgi:large subunit ribosomal protein L19|nr:50S ribosomal protein L19 [Clostridiales bacterium]